MRRNPITITIPARRRFSVHWTMVSIGIQFRDFGNEPRIRDTSRQFTFLDVDERWTWGWRGYARIMYLRGHMAAWRRAGLREER
jgi:hypothetical protein